MGLTGSLEDLNLGELLQIVSLSRKTGMLALEAPAGQGHVHFLEGAVCGAGIAGEAADLRSLLAASGELATEDYDRARAWAETRELLVEDVLVEGGALERDRLEALRRDRVQAAVLAMCAWSRGEFCFERDAKGQDDPALRVHPGLSAEFLVMEAARKWDEEGLGGDPSPPDPVDLVAEAALDSLDRFGEEEAAPSPEPPPVRTLRHRPVVALDREPGVLSWIRNALGDEVERLEVFDSPEAGVETVGRYLAGGDRPVLLIDPELGPDPLTGAGDAESLVRWLKSLSPRLRVLWLDRKAGWVRLGRPSGPADGRVEKPSPRLLRDPRHGRQLDAMGAALAASLAELPGESR